MQLPTAYSVVIEEVNCSWRSYAAVEDDISISKLQKLEDVIE